VKEIPVAENKKQPPDKENNRAASNDSGKPASSDVGRVESVILGAAAALGKLWHAVTDDGILAAAGRQGIDELGAALKAFPDAIQMQETGTLWNPTQGEIAADRQHTRHGGNHFSSNGARQPWPSEIAEQNRHRPANDHSDGHDNGHDAGHSM
jgi:hypothetical protein